MFSNPRSGAHVASLWEVLALFTVLLLTVVQHMARVPITLMEAK